LSYGAQRKHQNFALTFRTPVHEGSIVGPWALTLLGAVWLRVDAVLFPSHGKIYKSQEELVQLKQGRALPMLTKWRTPCPTGSAPPAVRARLLFRAQHFCPVLLKWWLNIYLQSTKDQQTLHWSFSHYGACFLASLWEREVFDGCVKRTILAPGIPTTNRPRSIEDYKQKWRSLS